MSIEQNTDSMHIDRKEQEFGLLFLLLFLIAAVRLAWMQPIESVTPYFAGPPDELSRYMIPQYIYQHGTLPTGFEPEVQIGGYGGSYAFMPGLPYIFMALFMKVGSLFSADPHVLLFSARCFNVLMGLLMSIYVMTIGRMLFKKPEHYLLFSAMVIFLPEMLFVHTYVNTDSMAMLGITLMVYALLAMYQEQVRMKWIWYFSIGAILCTLSYYNSYGMLLVSIPIFIGAFYKDKLDTRNMFKYGFIILGIWAAGSLWWYIRNGIILDGDLFGMATMSRVQAETGLGARWSYYQDGKSIIDMFLENQLARGMFISYIAAYGGRSIFAPIWYYGLYALIFGVGIISALVYCIRHYREFDGKVKLFTWMMMLEGLITVGLWLYYCYVLDLQPQGRYLLPATLPLMFVLGKGYEALSEWVNAKLIKSERAMIGLLYMFTFGILFLCVYYVLKIVLPVYRLVA